MVVNQLSSAGAGSAVALLSALLSAKIEHRSSSDKSVFADTR